MNTWVRLHVDLLVCFSVIITLYTLTNGVTALVVLSVAALLMNIAYLTSGLWLPRMRRTGK